MGNVFGSLFLISTGGAIGIAAAAFVVALAAGIGLGLLVHKKSYEKKVGEINQVVEKMLDEARAEGKTLKKEAILEAKEQELKLRNDFERESKEKRAELARTENRLIQKEDSGQEGRRARETERRTEQTAAEITAERRGDAEKTAGSLPAARKDARRDRKGLSDEQGRGKA